MTPRQRAVAWAAEITADPSTVFLDTETTGLGVDADICDIAIVALDGTVMLDTLVKPLRPIPAEARAVHGIDDAMVATAPTWERVSFWVRKVTDGRRVVIYNADYDAPIIRRLTHGIGSTTPILDGAQCAMRAYSEYDGTRSTNPRRPGLKWHRLGDAAAALGIDNPGAHRALADAETTRRLVLAMAMQSEPVPEIGSALEQRDLPGLEQR